MRMDRYDEENSDALKKSRTNKNQELYTDVYLNNAYVDISEITDVVNGNLEDVDIKKKVETEPVSYTYQEKNYDINELVDKAIQDNEDNLKRSLEQTTEIENIIKSINESQKQKDKEDNLLSELLADSDTTTIVEPLGNVITDTSEMDTSILHKDEMSNDMLEDMEDTKLDLSKSHTYIKYDYDNNQENDEIDDSLKDETKISKKKIFIIVGGVLVLIAIIIGILIFKKVIKL